MSKSIDNRQCSGIFPEIIELRFKNETGANSEDPNFVDALARLKLLDADGNELTIRVNRTRLWEGTAKLTLNQITNNLESTLGAALTAARIFYTGA